jgi:hypothetical protein
MNEGLVPFKPRARVETLKQVVDPCPLLVYKLSMICASLRLTSTIDSRGFAVGPEGMRVR